LLIGSVAAGCLVAACADIFGIHNADVDGSATGDGGGDAIPDVPYDYNVFDAVEFDVNTAVCGDGGVPFVDAGDAVWVSANTGSDNGTCGAQGAPCKSITQALTNRGSRNVVYLDDSTFNEVVNLAQSGITVQGGWVQGDAGWSAVCNNTGSIIQGPSDAGPAAVEVSAGDITLRLLTVRSKTQGAQGSTIPTPESVFAVRAINAANLKLDNVTLVAQNAGGGQPGTTPGNSPFCSTFPGDASNGTTGSPGPAGTFTTSGSSFAVSPGGSGTPGSPGKYTSGNPPACSSACNNLGCP